MNSIDKNLIKCCDECNRRIICKYCKYEKKHSCCNQCIEEIIEEGRVQKEYFGLVDIQPIAIEIIDNNRQLSAGEIEQKKKVRYYGVAGNHFNNRPVYF